MPQWPPMSARRPPERALQDWAARINLHNRLCSRVNAQAKSLMLLGSSPAKNKPRRPVEVGGAFYAILVAGTRNHRYRHSLRVAI
jgi:hypothetical protein